jgi:hypothetical protein
LCACATLREALAWCDVAHFCTPFVLGHVGAMLAAEMGVPRTAASPSRMTCVAASS